MLPKTCLIALVSEGETPKKRAEGISQTYPGLQVYLYFPLKEVQASRPVAEVLEHSQNQVQL